MERGSAYSIHLEKHVTLGLPKENSAIGAATAELQLFEKNISLALFSSKKHQGL